MSLAEMHARARGEVPAFSRPSRYINRMALFVGGVAVVALLLFQGLSNAFMANPALNGVIVGLLLVGIGFAFRSVLRLGREIDWLTWYQTYISHPRPQTITPPRPSLLAPMARMLGDRPRRLSLSATSLRSLLDGIDARLSEGRELSRYLIGLLIFLGLLGTFWGLLQTVGAVSDVIGNLSVSRGELAIVFAELQAGLEAPLGGMGTAFSSSLFGL
ncbi:MAG: flagellar motor protein MotA, partial [Rhodospirillaceae bacterium]|nr:flagellar motor protein MotA [Rhodospirillaceae bacterium]